LRVFCENNWFSFRSALKSAPLPQATTALVVVQRRIVACDLLMLHILAAVAQFERELIHERVSAGMRAAKTHGTKTGNAIGRPRRIFNRDEVARLRETGLSIERIAGQMRIGVGTVVRVLQAIGKVQTV
jgi:DNA invertase Pin-like site-specific DNA recombinase